MVLLASLAMLLPFTILRTPQTNSPFEPEIIAFHNADRKNPPAKGQILFIGSSSFTKWTDVGDYFPDRKILNRAFGGSAVPDVIHYLDDVVFPYDPKQIVIYCGENDFAYDAKLEPADVFNRIHTLFRLIRNRLPEVPIAYVSLKPSPSRWKFKDKFIATNRRIEGFLRHQKSAVFIDVWNAMLDENGRPKEEIFQNDKLHMNAAGYHIWQPIFDKVLLKEGA